LFTAAASRSTIRARNDSHSGDSGCRPYRRPAGALMSRSVMSTSAWPTARRTRCRAVAALPGSSGDIGSDDIGGVPVQRGPGPVVPHRGPWISMGSGLLHVPQRDPGVQRGGDERVPQRMRPDGLSDPGAAGDTANSPPRAMPVQPPAVRGQEDRPVASLADGQVDRPGGAQIVPFCIGVARAGQDVYCGQRRCPQRRWPWRGPPPGARRAEAAVR